MNQQSPSQLTFRPATTADAPLLVSILHAAFEEYREKLDPPAGVHHESVDTILQKLQEGTFIIALLGETPAGCVFYKPGDGGNFLYLGRLAVLPPYRQHGLGRTLIDYVEQRAAEQGLPSIQLGVRVELTHLHEYYARLGYRPISYHSHQGYDHPTFVIMEKTL